MKKVVLVALVLAGCAAPHYTKEGVSNDEARQDAAQCRYQAESATAPIYDVIERTIRRNELIESCLQSRGYRRG